MMAAAKAITSWDWSRVQRIALLASAAGLLVWAPCALLSPAHFFRAYLVAYNYLLGIALGCLVLLMIQYLTGGAWGFLLRGIFEAAVETLPLLAVLILPLGAGLDHLYVWTQPEVVAADPELAHKSSYLNVPFFLERTAVYLVVWLAIGLWLRRWSRQQERSPGKDFTPRLRAVSAVGLLLYGVTITFASIDWVMSLQPNWYSTIFPVMFAVGQVLSGMAFAVILLVIMANDSRLAGYLDAARQRDLGNLLLALVMVWAYLSFSQFLIIWAENLPHESTWYLNRLRGGWQWVALLLVVFEFGIPFLLLLSRDVKERRTRLAAVALVVLAMRMVDLFWWIEAVFPSSPAFSWLLDAAAVVSLGGIWTWWFVGALKSKPLLPVGDPYFGEYLPEAHHG